MRLIYLAVGLGIAALVVADLVYADSHERKMWMPSTFAFRLVYTTALLGYFIVREARKVKATRVQVVACLMFASLVHLGIAFGFRQTVDALSGLSFSALATIEMFLIWLLTQQIALYLRFARA